jgi:hypothetical protein
MPRIVQGLDAVIRTHRISSPTDPEMLRQGSPNACNLCHLERPLRWTLAELARGWAPHAASGKATTWRDSHAGDLDQPLVDAWLEHEVPITRLVLTDALVRSAARDLALPRLTKLLNDPNPVNRVFALFAMEAVLGRSLSEQEYEPTATPQLRRQQVQRLDLAVSVP